MIGYLYLKSNNQIVSIVRNIHTITDTDVLGLSDYAKGNDFSMLDILCVDEPLTKIKTVLNGFEEVELETLDTLDALTLEGLDNRKNDILMSTIRTTRNTLLTECDWTQLSDTPLTTPQKESWSTYRQQLRDLPETVDLSNIIYPSKPE